MDIRNPKSLLAGADEALAVGRKPRQVILWYTGLITLLAVAVMAADYVIDTQLAKATGLSNLGLNSILSTVKLVLPWVQMVAQMCLNLGYLYAMLRVGRKLYADQNDLKEGFRRFGPLLRMFLMQFVLCMALGFILMYPLTIIYVFTPFSAGLVQWTESLPATDPAALAAFLAEESTMNQLMEVMLPFMILYLVVYLVAMLPISYHFRMANYLLAEDSRCGAFAALRGSFRMMRRNCLKLLKVDLRLWWYHVLVFLVGLIAYGDSILAAFGISLPVSGEAAFYIFQLLYFAALFAVYYFFRNRVELTYIMAYECLRPKEEKTNSIVLGNIFQM